MILNRECKNSKLQKGKRLIFLYFNWDKKGKVYFTLSIMVTLSIKKWNQRQFNKVGVEFSFLLKKVKKKLIFLLKEGKGRNSFL